VRAIRAAIRIQRMLGEREEHYRVMAGGHPLRVRIGVNTGHVLVGNLGSNTRFDYSVLGDAANLASRLEGANKAFGTHILCSLDTWSRTQGRFHGRVLGRVMVVGRNTPVQIVEPLCFIEEPMPDKALLVAQAIAMCGEGQAHQAIAQLEQLADDPVAAAFVKYLKTLKPDQTLDGVWRLTSK
jgi:adenylate cyclase